jgi:hypothetical protein
VAFHNGSAIALGTVSASQEFKDIMRPILLEATGHKPREAASTKCHGFTPRPQPSPFDASFLGFFYTCLSWIWQILGQHHMEKHSPLHHEAHSIQKQLLVLPPFANMTSAARSNIAVAVQIPSWLVGTQQACHVLSASASLFGRVVAVENTPSSAYTAAGYELCRLSYDTFDCTGPGRLMTLEYDGEVAVASLVQTPLAWWAKNPITFAVSNGLTAEEMSDWINLFIETKSPDELIIAGAAVGSPLFQKALTNSRAQPYLDRHTTLPSQHVLVMGTALAAKEALESHKDDCGEWEECVDLRKEADRIAGSYKPLHKPPSWPAYGTRHTEL